MKHTTRKEIKKKIAEILLDHNWVKPGEKVHERHSYENDYGMDSLDKLELAMDLGREYGVYIPDEVEERMDTVAITIDYIHQQLNNYESKQN
jgi:acyl carrier protein